MTEITATQTTGPTEAARQAEASESIGEATGSRGTATRQFSLIAGWCGLAAAIAYIATIVTTSLFNTVEPYDGPDDIVRYLNEVADQPAPSLVYGIAGVAMALLFLPFGVAVGRALQRTALAQIGTIAMIVGLVALIPAYAMSLIEGAVLASTVRDAGIDDQASLYMVAEFASGVSIISFTVGSVLTLCVAPLLWGLAGRRTGVFSNRVNWTGVAVGVSGLVWFVWFLETPLLLAVMLINALTSIVYFVVLALRLRSRGQ